MALDHFVGKSDGFRSSGTLPVRTLPVFRDELRLTSGFWAVDFRFLLPVEIISVSVETFVGRRPRSIDSISKK